MTKSTVKSLWPKPLSRITVRTMDKNAQSRWLAFLLVFLSACSGAPKREAVPSSKLIWDGSVKSQSQSRFMPLVGTAGMVVSDDREASEWGAEILRKGGNAVDAAVATAFALSVSRPHFASLGGGGFIVYCPKPRANKPECHVLDFREVAPQGVRPEMFVAEGKLKPELTRNGALASGVPGMVAGFMEALSKFGTRSRQELLSRPIQMAAKGVRLSTYTEYALYDRWEKMNPETRRIFGCGTKPCASGTLLKQPDLGRVLEAVSKKGASGFYQGWVAKRLAHGIQEAGGVLSEQDLAHYHAVARKPLYGSYLGHEIVTMPPPSAGGTLLLQMFRYMELADQQGAFDRGFGAPESLHALAHAMALSYADRAFYFGDPDSVHIPIPDLLSKNYLDPRWKSTFRPGQVNIPEKAGVVAPMPANSVPDPEKDKDHTTHLSVVDREGNAVAMTLTINDNMGSGFVPPGTGIVMNNELDDFSVLPDAPNLFGLVGSQANAMAPGKKPLSSMTPTVVRDSAGNVELVIGAAGGARITTSVFQALFNRLRWGMSLSDAVNAPRVHHQWRPNLLRMERFGFTADTRDQLRKFGYALEDANALARIHALERFPNGRVWGAPDRRAEGAGALP